MCKNKKWIYGCIGISIVIVIILVAMSKYTNTVFTSSNLTTMETSNNDTKKMSWGIKRNSNHEQPDVGSENKKTLDENEGICLGNNLEKNIYLTFDCGYEAGYTEKILDVLKENDVKATFFITSHYLNTASDIVKRTSRVLRNVSDLCSKYLPSLLDSEPCDISSIKDNASFFYLCSELLKSEYRLNEG